jgi:hypothetical protein
MTRTDSSASIEDRLTDALRSGTEVDLIPEALGEELLGEEVMHGWGPDHDVEAELVRQLLLRGLDDDVVDPRGLRLRGARIRGRLDLDLVDTRVALRLRDCLLEHGISAQQAHLPLLTPAWCRLRHPDRPAVDGDRLHLEGELSLDTSVIAADGAGECGALRAVVLGAHGALARTPDRTATAALASAAATGPLASAPASGGPQPCTLIEQIGKGLDLGTPFLPRAATTRCEPTTTATGAALVVITWVLQVIAWALAALFVVGFTGIVRKT